MRYIPVNLLKAAIISLIVLAVLIGNFLSYFYILPAAVGTLRFLTPAFLPFILAWIIAELIDPPVSYLENHCKFSRGLIVLGVLFLLFGGLTTGVVWLITRLTIELVGLSKYLPQLSNSLTSYLLQLFNQVADFYFSLGLNYNVAEQIIGNIADNAEKLINKSTVLIGQLLTGSFHLLSLVPEVLLVIVFTLMGAFFISRDKTKIMKRLVNLVPQRTGRILESTSKEIGGALVGFLRAQFILMLLIFFQTLLGLHFLGLNFALIIALLVSFVDALPIIGPGAVFVPWIIWEILNRNIPIALGLVILYIFITITRQILQPKIVSTNVGIHPLEALLGIYIGLKIFGVLGVFIGPILLITVKAFWRGWKKHAKE